MLPANLRMRNSGEFAATVRRGHREGSKTVVLHAWRPAEPGPEGADIKVGFVVSKRVGMAVLRNRTKRRLRHLVRHLIQERPPSLPPRLRIVIRALPAAAGDGDRLAADLGKVWSRSFPEATAAVGPDRQRRQKNTFSTRGRQS
jgi:ribonuclease P protein component